MTDMRTYINLVESNNVSIPTTPMTNKPIGTVLLLISGDDFDERRVPYVATTRGWCQLDGLATIKGRQDGTLVPNGETIDDAALKADPRRKALAAKPSWPMISHLYQLEALPPGSIVLRPELDTDTDPEQRQQVKQRNGTWSVVNSTTGERANYKVDFMSGHLDRYELVKVGGDLTEALVPHHDDPPDLDPDDLRQLASEGFDVEHPLYHGSDADITAFDLSFARTAAHIYTSPDPATAAGYGTHLYLVFGRMGREADLTEDWQLLGKLAEAYADRFYDSVEQDENLEDMKQTIVAEEHANGNEDFEDWDVQDDPRWIALREKIARGYAIEVFQSGTLYNDFGASFQNTIMDECFAMGYNSVFFFDGSSNGAWESVVFERPEDVIIAKKLK